MKEQVTLENGKAYTQVDFFLYQSFRTSVNQASLPDIYSKSLLARNIGLVQFESEFYPRLNYQLLRYHVSRR